MSEKVRPTSLVLGSDLLMDIELHAYSNLEAEVGGMLFGEVSDGKTVIAGSVPAAKAAAEQISLTFTHEVWEDILKVGEERFPGKSIVGWYHTHPSFGLFLSEYDQFIQKNFFSNPGQIALVIDPIAGNMGWFALKKNGKIEMFYQEETNSGPRTVAKREAQRESSIFKLVTIGASCAIVGAAVGWSISLTNLPPDQRSVVQNLTLQQEMLVSDLTRIQGLVGDQTDGKLTFFYETSGGDTLQSLTRQFWGSKGKIDFILDANPNVKSGQVLAPGTVLQIVDALGFELQEWKAAVTPYETPTPTPTPTQKGTPSPTPKVTKTPTPLPSTDPSSTPSPTTSNT
jgi:proteasome lid subunit RPN8/RPN11